MDYRHIAKDWTATTALTFMLYELLWRLVYDSFDPFEGWYEIAFDMCYCGLFSLTSISISILLGKIDQLNSLTMPSQTMRCVATLLINICIAFCFEKGYNWLLPPPDSTFFWQGFYLFCIIATLLTLVRTTIHYAIMAIRQREELNAMQKKALHNQLNPHFVFNSLSSLAELIHANPQAAERYVISLSKAYRYVLSHLETDYASIADSVSFIREYVALQQVRLAGKIELEINLDGRHDEMLYAMSLQLLVENAIKHNRPEEGERLHIKIRREEDYVVVSNNMKDNATSAESFGIGLDTLCHRYRIDGLNEPRFSIENGEFEVILPIIRNTTTR